MLLPRSGNLLLNTLTLLQLAALGVSEEDHPIEDVLLEIGDVPHSMIFPHAGALASIVHATENGTMVEVGIVGGEGAFNLHSVLATSAVSSGEALVQADGRFSRVNVEPLRHLFAADEPFRTAMLAYTSLYLHQVTQTAICNRLHALEQRLAKWLLAVSDRIGSEELHLTHDFLSHMLGVHRPGVTIAVNALAQDGLIEHGRNKIWIREREGLVARSCECYATLREQLSRFAGEVGGRAIAHRSEPVNSDRDVPVT
jgi:CRP-like cAMP-binding protein